MFTAEKILNYMRENGSITTYEGFAKLGTTKLTSRISDLRKAGYNIIGTWEKTKNGERYMRYRLGE